VIVRKHEAVSRFSASIPRIFLWQAGAGFNIFVVAYIKLIVIGYEAC